MKTLQGEELRRAIDEAIAEVDRVEEEMLELFAELIGPDVAVQLAKYARAQEEQSPLRSLMSDQARSPEGSDATNVDRTKHVVPPASRQVTDETKGRE